MLQPVTRPVVQSALTLVAEAVRTAKKAGSEWTTEDAWVSLAWEPLQTPVGTIERGLLCNSFSIVLLWDAITIWIHCTDQNPECF